jgi:hypothetical protein
VVATATTSSGRPAKSYRPCKGAPSNGDMPAFVSNIPTPSWGGTPTHTNRMTRPRSTDGCTARASNGVSARALGGVVGRSPHRGMVGPRAVSGT